MNSELSRFLGYGPGCGWSGLVKDVFGTDFFKDFVCNDAFKKAVGTNSRKMEVKDGVMTIDIVVPGLSRDDVRVEVNKRDNVVKISSVFKEKDADDFWFVEPFEYTYELPEGVAYDTFKKTCENGVLTVSAEVGEKEKDEDYIITI